MNSLSEVAASYDERAQANEATAEEIMAFLDFVAAEIRDDQCWRADWLTTEAARLRARAEELRNVELRRSQTYAS